MKILVIGETCIDEFVYGEVKRLCPEAPVPVFNPSYETRNSGMAGNVVENLKALGVNDVYSLTNSNDSDVIIKRRFVDEKSNQMLLRVDINDECGRCEELTYIDFKEYDGVVVSDYNKGFLTHEDLIFISESHPLTFLDTKKRIGDWALDFTFIKINLQEWNNRMPDIRRNAFLKSRVIVTKGADGAMHNDIEYYVPKVEFKDVSGAGDTFLAALAYSYLSQGQITDAIEFANECASKVVQKHGVTTV